MINRTKEISLIETCINKNHIIDTYGSIGIGKTSFLYFVCDKLIPKKSLSVHINLSSVENIDELIKLTANKLNKFFYKDKYFSEFFKYIIDSDNEYSTDNAVILFGAALKVATESISIVLCFDNTEKLNSNIWEEFEEKILRYYIELKNVSHHKLKIITAGQRRMRWNVFHIREQVKACQLNLFDKESTKEMVQLLSKQERIDFPIENQDDIIDDIYSLTLGHPKSIQMIIQHWNDLQVDDKKYQKNFATLLVEKYIQPEFIDQAKELVKGKHYPSSSFSLLQNLSPLRFISTKILRETLSQLSTFSSFYSKQKYFFFKKLLDVLRDEHLLDWNKDRERYEFPAIIRHILLKDLKQNKTEDLIKLHQEIGDVYRKLTLDDTADRHAIFIEQLYHIISWQRIDNTEGEGKYDTEETLWNEIGSYLKEDREEAISLRSLLEADDYFKQMMNWEDFFRTL